MEKIRPRSSIRYGSYTGRNCGARGYFDVIKLCDVCDHCNNPDFDYDDGENVDSRAGLVLIACAQGRLNDASRLLEECRIRNSSAIATTLAEIAYANSRYGTSRAQSPEVRSLYLMNARKQLGMCLDSTGLVSPSETRLYRTLARSSFGDDALAVLMSIYDMASSLAEEGNPGTEQSGSGRESDSALGKKGNTEQNLLPEFMRVRAELCYKILRPEHLLTSLGRHMVLHAALMGEDWSRAAEIAANPIDCLYGANYRGDALNEILCFYPSWERKETLVRSIADRRAMGELPADNLIHYFSATQDPLDIRLEVARRSAGTAAFVGGDRLLEFLYEPAKAEGRERELFEVICAVSGRRGQPAALKYMLENTWITALDGFLEVLGTASRRPVFEADAFRGFLLRGDLPGEQKASVLSRIMTLPAATLLKRGIGKIYLCEANENLGDRLKVIDVIFTKDNPADTDTMERYLLRCTQDGPAKAQIIEKLFSSGTRLTSPGGMKERYLAESMDDAQTRSAVLSILSGDRSGRRRKKRSPFHFW